MRHASVPTSAHLCVDDIPGTAFGENAVSSVSVRGLSPSKDDAMGGSEVLGRAGLNFNSVFGACLPLNV